MLFLSSIAAIKCCQVTSVTTTCLIGSLCSGIGLIMTSVVTQFEWLYLVYGIFFGVGSSFLYTPGLIMIAKWFRKYQALTTGAAAASAALGAVVLSPLIQYVIQENGLRATIKSGGIVYLTVSLLCSLSYKPLENTIEGVIHSSESIQLSDIQNKQKIKFNLNFMLLKNKTYLMFLVVMMVTNATYYIPLIHLVRILLTI